MSSTVEKLERELGVAQGERESEEKAVLRAENAHEAACLARDEAWTEGDTSDPEVERLTALVFEQRRTLYGAIDRLKAAEGRERRIKSRLMYVLPAERRRYLSGTVDEEFEGLLAVIQSAYSDDLPGLRVGVVTEQPGEIDLGGDATWRALERLYGGTLRRWVEVRVSEQPDDVHATVMRLSAQVSYFVGGHLPRLFIAGKEVSPSPSGGASGFAAMPPYESPEGRESLARITIRRYLDEASVSRLGKRPDTLVQLAEIARQYQTINLTVDEIRWRLEQLLCLRLETLRSIHALTGQRRRFSFYEIARAARLLDAHFPDPGVAADALERAVRRSLDSGVPLVDVAYMTVTG